MVQRAKVMLVVDAGFWWSRIFRVILSTSLRKRRRSSSRISMNPDPSRNQPQVFRIYVIMISQIALNRQVRLDGGRVLIYITIMSSLASRADLRKAMLDYSAVSIAKHISKY